MKNLKLKLTIIGISLLSINAFAQDYVYNGIKNVDATIGMNNSESDSNQETVSEDCYDPENIGKTIQAQGCAGLLIVDNEILRDLVLGNNYTTIEGKIISNYSDTNIFTGQVTDMSYLFCNYDNQNYPKCTLKEPLYSISNWNTENVTNMYMMFHKSQNFNKTLNNWNVSNVTNMSYMFHNSSFNQPLNDWDVSNVTDMSSMFYGSNYNHSLNNWDVSNVTYMNYMFGSSLYNQPLNKWDVSNVTDMSYMFYGSNYNQPLNNWDVSNVTNMSYMFHGSNYNQPLNNWNVSNVNTMWSMFENSSYNHPLDNWDVSNVNNMKEMFNGAGSFIQNISNWCVTNIESKPNYFDTNSGFKNQTSLQPQWGTCP